VNASFSPQVAEQAVHWADVGGVLTCSKWGAAL